MSISTNALDQCGRSGDHLVPYENTYLSHHGIKGQKWGLRRFQNLDGSLTPEGRERYLKGMNSREKTDYLKTDDATRSRIERYMDRGLTYSDAKSMVERDRKDRNKKLLKYGAAAVATMLAAYGGYKLYQHLGNEAENARKFYRTSAEEYAKRIDNSADDIQTKYGPVAGMKKYWEKDDIKKYSDLIRKHGEENAAAVNRKSVLLDKLGLSRFSKEKHDREWRQRYERQNQYAIAEKKANLNREIEDQRAYLDSLKFKRDYERSPKIDYDKRAKYGFKTDEQRLRQEFAEGDARRRASSQRMIEVGQKTLEELLRRRRALD